MAKTQQEIDAKAEETWGQLNDSQKHGIRLGFFPYDVMQRLEREGFKDMCIPLMRVAERHGGKKS